MPSKPLRLVLVGDKDQRKVQAVMEAMMEMVKLDVAALDLPCRY